MKRIVSVWFPEFAIDRFKRHLRMAFPGRAQGVRDDRVPFALTVKEGQALRIRAANRKARDGGVRAGQMLADAFAVLPSLQTRPHEVGRDHHALEGLARWAVRYAPLTAIDGEDGLLLDVTGVPHLFGGDRALLGDLAKRLSENGFENRLAMAPTPGAAWALARFAHPASACICASKEALKGMLAPLPVEALRLAEGDARLLRRFGVKTVHQVIALPRAALARRFSTPHHGTNVLYRLDQVLGYSAEPIAPYLPARIFEVRRTFAEPCLSPDGIFATVESLLAELCQNLEAAGQGARSVQLVLCRVDASAAAISVRTRRATRAPRHLMQLLSPKLDEIDAGFGVDVVQITAPSVEPMPAGQHKLTAATNDNKAATASAALDRLADRLINRLGAAAVFTMRPVASHRPEHSEAPQGMLQNRLLQPARADTSSSPLPRPLRLFEPPQPIDVVATLPGFAPQSFRWRRVTHRIARVRGPERIENEWWRSPAAQTALRDYYDVEDAAGHRFWIFHARTVPLPGEAAHNDRQAGRWCLHGVFS